MNLGDIYVITNRINGKQYVGQCVKFSISGSKTGIRKRWQTHIRNARNRKDSCRALEGAIRKYGAENFTIGSIHECEIRELNEREKSYIDKLGTLRPHGYNLMNGGGNGRRFCAETLELFSKARKGKKHRPETKKKIRESRLGKKASDKTRIAIGKASKYRNMDPERIRKIKNALSPLGLQDLPMYIGFTIDKRYKRNVEIITVRGPEIVAKKFASKIMTLTEKITLAIEYLKSVNGHRSEELP